jgi:hypothetical protein
LILPQSNDQGASQINGGGDDMEIHLSLYDVTHRYDLEGDWMTRLMAVLKGEDSSSISEHEHDVLAEDQTAPAVSEDSSSLTRVSNNNS